MGSHVSRLLQFALTVPVWVVAGTAWAVTYLIAALLLGPLGGVLCERLGFVQALALGVMYRHLRSRLERRDLKWDAHTNEEGERFFESLFSGVVREIETLAGGPEAR